MSVHRWTQGLSPVSAPTVRKGAVRISDVVKSTAPAAPVSRRRSLLPSSAAGRNHRCRRSLGVRQDNASQRHCRLPRHFLRRITSTMSFLRSRPAEGGAGCRPDRGIPEWRTFSVEDQHRECDVRPHHAGTAVARPEAYDKARDMMAEAGLRDIEHNYPGEISSGVRRRVEIVRALMNDPKSCCSTNRTGRSIR